MKRYPTAKFLTQQFWRASLLYRPLSFAGGILALSIFLAGCSSLGEFKPAKEQNPDIPTTDGLVTGEKGQLEYNF